MRVALLSYNAQPGDAIGNQVAEKLTFFREHGAEVRVHVQVDSLVHPKVRPHYRLMKKPVTRGEGWDFISTADLVIAEYGQYYTLLELLPLLAGGKPRIVLDYHGVTPPELWGNHNREALEKGVANRGLVWCADAVIVHSRFTESELREHTGYPAERLHRTAYPTDLSFFGAGEVEYDWRKALGLEAANVLLCVCRLAPNKRVPLIVEAVAQLRDLDPPVHLLIAGPINDLYHDQAEQCRAMASQLGVVERIHFIGPQIGSRLRDAYRAADVFVTASLWESFCIPVIEAMACGVPVVAARATALPEIVASAGLTFEPDDADDLARQIRRVLSTESGRAAGLIPADRTAGINPAARHSPLTTHHSPLTTPKRIAIVAFRYGEDIVCGAATSLRTMARALRDAGCTVEIFTTTTRTTSAWRDELPEGSKQLDGILVHRYRIEPHDSIRHNDIVQRIAASEGRVSAATEEAYLRASLNSERLLEAINCRQSDFSAIIVGPYLYALTHEVACRFAERVLLVPCFHDEPIARLRIWRSAYEQVGGILYHSPEEKAWSERTLGLNHPGARVLGTVLNNELAGKPEAGRAFVGGQRPYLAYCGRYSEHKDVPRLLDFARRYETAHSGRFTFVFMGHGEVPIPREVWVQDLGFVDEAVKRDVLAGAAALVQLSPKESLSIVALEAWAQGVPVIASAQCEVMAGHIERSAGGLCVDGYEQFARALSDLVECPASWRDRGRCGQQYVRETYGDPQPYQACLLSAIADLSKPLREPMRRRGFERAAECASGIWRQRFGGLVERLVDDAPRPFQMHVDVQPRLALCSVPAGAGTQLMQVCVTNHGTHALAADGPARVLLRCRVDDSESAPAGRTASSPLPRLLMPGQSVFAVVPVPAPDEPGNYRVSCWANRLDDHDGAEMSQTAPPDSCCRLIVEPAAAKSIGSFDTVLRDEARAVLAKASMLQQLPDDYVDVTEGFLATWKRRLKRKLLGNLKHSYIDVLSRQQSAFNQHLLIAVQGLTEHCATLEHSVLVLQRQINRLRRRRRRKRNKV